MYTKQTKPNHPSLITRSIMLLIALVFALLPVQAVQAEGIVGQITASNSSVTVGNTVTVTFSAVPAVTVSAYQVTIGFDTALFEYVSGSDLTGLNGGSSIDNNGSSISVFAYGDTGVPNATKLCKLTFKAKAEGSGTFTTSAIVINDESPVSTSVSVTVGAAGATTATTAEPTTEASTAAPTATLEFADGTYTAVALPKAFPTPTGFYRTAITISGVRMEAFKATKGDLVLIYLDSESSGSNLYFYDSNANSVYQYEPFSLPGHDFVLIRPDASAVVPAGFSSTSLTLNGQQINCWTKLDITDPNDPYYETYLLYLLDSEGQKGFYLYKPAKQMIFPYLLLEPVTGDQSETSSTSADQQPVGSQTEAASGILPGVKNGLNIWMIGTGVFALLSLMLLGFLVWTYFEYIRPIEKQQTRPERILAEPRRERPVPPAPPVSRPVNPPAPPVRPATAAQPQQPIQRVPPAAPQMPPIQPVQQIPPIPPVGRPIIPPEPPVRPAFAAQPPQQPFESPEVPERPQASQPLQQPQPPQQQSPEPPQPPRIRRVD